MIILSIATVFGLMACGLALQANARFKGEHRLPMQWWLNGEVTWTAPRKFALAFLPALTIGVLGFFVFLANAAKPRAGQEWLLVPSLIFLGGMFLAIQLLHYWLISRSLRKPK